MKRFLETPQAGLAPWIVIALVEEAASVEAGAAAALAVTLVLVALGRIEGVTPKLLEVADVVFFIGLFLVALLGSDDLNHTLEQWAGEISAGAITAIGLGSILVRRPFTLQYGEAGDPDSPYFLHAHYVVTAAWTAAFAITALGGVLGHELTGHSGNFWTAWTVQAGALIVAWQFTRWYPDVARARARRTEPPPLAVLVVPLTPWLITLGILTLALETAPDLVGVALILAGAMLTRLLSRGLSSPR